MNAHNPFLARRALIGGVAATATALAGGAAAQQAQAKGPFTKEGWQAAWRNPDASKVLARIPLITTPDVVGYWPRTTHPVRGQTEYARRIVDLLTLIPDFRAELIEHASNDDFLFLRWSAKGTGPAGPFEAVGADRLVVSNGYVAENLILSDHPIFATIARHVGDLRPDF